MIPRHAASPAVDHVIGRFARESLSAALAATHRAGFGPQTRVIDGARGGVTSQLERMGLWVAEETPPPSEAILIVVTAPGRTAIVADLFSRLGADRIMLAGRRDETAPSETRRNAFTPDIRIGKDAEATPGH